jgi:hypothetical protein
MAKQAIKRAITSKLVRVFVQDSSQADGRGLTGLVFNSAGLVAYYIKEGQSAPTAITLVTMTVGTWVSGGFKEVDPTNMPGFYELGLPDAMLSTGNSVAAILRGATNMAPVPLEIQLDAFDAQDTVRLGLTALPNAAAGANGGLPTGDASGRVTVGSLAAAAIQSIWDALTSALTTSGSVGKLLVDNINATIASRLASASYTAPDNATIAAISGAVDTEIAAILAKTNLIPANPAAVGSVMLVDMTQAVPTSNTAQTVGDALNAARAQGFGKWAISGASLLLYAADGTTIVRTFLLDSATTPTSRT